MLTGTLRLLVLYSWVGLTICLLVHVASFLILLPGGTLLLAGLSFGVFPPFAILVRLDLDAMQRVTASVEVERHDLFERVFPCCPPPIRKFVRWLWLYAAVATFVFLPIAAISHDAASPVTLGAADLRAFSAALLFFYGAALAGATSAYYAAKTA
ncbi:MAG: hypothetical protein E7774_03240 [Bradyrhizobium sp.]|nr:MAG: hypothetical protein E7774_03240 [Bradyrhizobium sp.]